MLVLLAALVYCGATVPLGERTFFEHMSRIWSTNEAQELVEGVKETSQPVVDKLKRGVEAGYEEITRDDAQSPGEATRPPGDEPPEK